MLTKILHISICTRENWNDMGYVYGNESFRQLETDFILEKARAFILTVIMKSY
jgi:hypothetical protein